MVRHISQLFSVRAIACALGMMVSGCSSLPLPCLPPSSVMTSAEIIFGRNIGDRPGVSEADFASFLGGEVTPRFPDGLTVIDGNGQWRDPTRGASIRERAKVLLVTFADDAAKRADLVAIADAYKRRFRQQSVLTKVTTACVSF